MYLYWIRHDNDSDPYTQGYIGISNNPERRLKEHTKYSENNLLKGALNNGATMTVLHSDLSEEEARSLEEQYRPTEYIGLNITKGGGRPPNSWLTGDKEQHARNIQKALKANGTHNLCKANRKGRMGNEYDSESARAQQKKLIEEGRHNLAGNVLAVTEDGSIITVSKQEYYERKGELVTINSTIGKERRNDR